MKSVAAIVLFFLFGFAPASAQTDSEPGAKPKVVPDTDVGKKNGDLSDKLNSTNGVIHPRE